MPKNSTLTQGTHPTCSDHSPAPLDAPALLDAGLMTANWYGSVEHLHLVSWGLSRHDFRKTK